MVALALAMPLLQGCVGAAAAGMGAAALMATDRRTTGIYVEDENIEWKAIARCYAAGDFTGKKDETALL